MNPYLWSVYRILTKGQKTNSYKFALTRALVRVVGGSDTGDMRVTKNQLAPYFLEYYWPIETKFRIRQGTDPSRNPKVMVFIRQAMQSGAILRGEQLAKFRKRNPGAHREILDKVEREAFEQVIPRFHKVQRVKINPPLFEHTGVLGRVGDTITIPASARDALVVYGSVIDHMAIAAWVAFTEQYSSAPKLFQKISGEKPVKGNVSKWRSALRTVQSGRCFYCPTDVSIDCAVDHALPWSFVYENKTWNLVAACPSCNRSKLDGLFDNVTLARLLARNRQIVDEDVTVPSTFLRDFREWKSRDLAGHIRTLYDQARQDGFPLWQRSGM